MDSRVLHSISYGVYIISTYDQGNSRHTGCVANSVMQVTSSPATLAVSINRQNHTHACISESGMLSVAVLSEKSDPALIGTFGFASGRDKGKYDGIAHTVEKGIARPDDCCGYMLCKVVGRLEAGSHTVFLAEVLDGSLLSADAPMTYSFYHKVIKGRTAKNAPTYIEEEAAPVAEGPKAQAVWRCTVCGYEYTGQPPFEQLPQDYTCPICGVPKSKFQPL